MREGQGQGIGRGPGVCRVQLKNSLGNGYCVEGPGVCRGQEVCRGSGGL